MLKQVCVCCEFQQVILKHRWRGKGAWLFWRWIMVTYFGLDHFTHFFWVSMPGQQKYSRLHNWQSRQEYQQRADADVCWQDGSEWLWWLFYQRKLCSSSFHMFYGCLQLWHDAVLTVLFYFSALQQEHNHCYFCLCNIWQRGRPLEGQQMRLLRWAPGCPHP